LAAAASVALPASIRAAISFSIGSTAAPPRTQARPEEELTARVVAAQIAGVYRVLYYTARTLLLDGLQGPEMTEALGRAARRAFDLLAADLSGFDPRPRLRSTS